ncbi:MAG: ribonucleoside reductase, partial [Proteobacteria bacterium]|nr:ribonucleoside reductase [Pseudomonadota bacterium]
AGALAAPEKDAAWAERFYGALEDFKFLPAGRIVAGAGTQRHVTLFNCFVMGTIPDDMSGIFSHLREAALTMQQGGGIGYDFSTLRPKGAPVKGVGADASGPLTFMDVWDAMCRTIMSAGHRRGAMMATLACDHPDIEAFIEAKREPGRLRMFNLSVLVSDAFMTAVKEDAPWELTFGGSSFKTLRARELWDKIMRATYAYAEPGVIFIDRINRRNNLHYCETIRATNPCVPGDTWVHTAEGPRQVKGLLDTPFAALVDGRPFLSEARGFFATGHKPILRLTTKEGYALRLTADHLVRAIASKSRYRIETRWTKACELQTGDLITLHDHRAAQAWGGEFGEAEGYLLGLLIGDGTLKRDKAVLSIWPRALAANGTPDADGTTGIRMAALAAAQTLPHRADFRGWMDVAGRGEQRMALGALRDLAFNLGMRPGSKAITPRMERASSAFYSGLLRGLFDTDGTVLGSQEKGVSVRLSQSDLPLLEAVQRMLLRLGVVATIYCDRRPAGERRLPDGKGGYRDYHCLAQHELVISNDNVRRFAEIVGFADTEKQRKLDLLLTAYRRAPNRERFVAEIEAIELDGIEDVYDVQIPGVNAFDANGLYVHNCGEQPLPPYGACLLGSINLAALIRDPFTSEARLDEEELDRIVPLAVRMMDNAIDASRFPLQAQHEEAQAKRRIGLGVTGLADALIMCRARYGSEAAVALTRGWMRRLQRHAYLASAELASEKGAFPLYERDKYLAGETVAALDKDVKAGIAKHGIRNALLTSIAPTGTISILADNVSSGLEPVFSFSYLRNVLMPDGQRRTEEVSDYAYRLYRRLYGEAAGLPDYFVDAQHLSPAEHVVMQAAVQEFVDSSISKTINCPEDISFESFKDIYTQAYELGCKGCTTYRPNEITGAVLSVKPDDKAKAALPVQQALQFNRPPARPADLYDAGGVVYMTKPLGRPEVLPGRTYKLRWPDSEHAIYITINDVVQDGRRRPFEVFINSKNTEHYAWTVALTRMISAVFRRGGDVSFVVDELKAVFDPRGGQWMGGRYVPSLLAAIGEVIERHMIDIGFLSAGDRGQAGPQAAAVGAPQLLAASEDGSGSGASSLRATVGLSSRHMRQCPKCGAAALIRQEGCDTCTSCDYSKCA